jgi:hypothetical protein
MCIYLFSGAIYKILKFLLQFREAYPKMGVPELHLALLTSIRQGRKGFSWTSTLAYPSCGQCYKSFYGRNLRIFVINKSVCPGELFQPSLMFMCKVRSLPWR